MAEKGAAGPGRAAKDWINANQAGKDIVAARVIAYLKRIESKLKQGNNIALVVGHSGQFPNSCLRVINLFQRCINYWLSR